MPSPAPQATRALRLARRLHRHVAYPLLAFLLPARCFSCGRPLGLRQQLGACPRCWTGLPLLRPPLCPGCALPRPAATDLCGPARGRCAGCLRHPPPADAMCAVVAYEGIARDFLLRAKLGRRPELLAPLGAQLARRLALERFARGCTRVVAVPSRPWTGWLRGFCPARELARPVARRLGLPLARRALRRRMTPAGAVKRMSARRRRQALADAFVVRQPLDGARVLLIDDVVTTGATVQACAVALRRAGAAEVRAAAWARTLPRDTRAV